MGSTVWRSTVMVAATAALGIVWSYISESRTVSIGDRLDTIGITLIERPMGSPPNVLRRKALLVGCQDYPNLPPSLRLRGPINDVELVKRVLIGRFGFSDEDILILADNAERPERLPTRDVILAELDRLSEQAAAGDLIVVYLSGHGTQQPDDPTSANDDPEPDGLDEVFCTRDVQRVTGGGGKTVPGGIVDDELRAAVKAIVNAGAHAWVIVDTCHSGTMARAKGGNQATYGDVSRALPPDQLLPPAVAAAVREKAESNRERDLPAKAVHLAPLATQKSSGKPSAQTGANSRLVVMYASQSSEPTVENRLPPKGENRQRHGLFTFALVEALQAASPDETYEDVLTRIQKMYRGWGRTSPSPWVEGEGAGYPLFGLSPPAESSP